MSSRVHLVTSYRVLLCGRAAVYSCFSESRPYKKNLARVDATIKQAKTILAEASRRSKCVGQGECVVGVQVMRVSV